MTESSRQTDVLRVIKLELDDAKIRAIILQLSTEFIGGTTQIGRNPSGGLIGLAAVAIALGKDCALFLELIVPAGPYMKEHTEISAHMLQQPRFTHSILFYRIALQHCKGGKG